MRILFPRLFIALVLCCPLSAANAAGAADVPAPASPLVAADGAKPDTFTVHQLLDGVAMTYANCKTYRDTGVVKTIFFQANGKRTVNKPFSTAFVRPNRFRFEYRERRGDEDENRYLICSNGREVQTWWDVQPEINKKATLNLALAGATGVSGRSAHTVPVLLLPDEIQGKAIISMTEIKRIADARLDNVDCFRVEGKYANVPQTLWIDKKSFLIRRIDSQHTFPARVEKQRTYPGFRTETTTTYESVMDGEIADTLLAFDPPQ